MDSGRGHTGKGAIRLTLKVLGVNLSPKNRVNLICIIVTPNSIFNLSLTLSQGVNLDQKGSNE